MGLYAWRCRHCGWQCDLPSREHPQVCGNCGENMARDYSSVQMGGNSAFQPHFNHAVGQFVSSDSEFRTALKRGAEKAGSDEYIPVYPGDVPRPTKDDHIFETRERFIRDNKINEADLRK